MDIDGPSGDLRARTELAQVTDTLNLLRVRRDAWPWQDFVEYVEALKIREGIPSDAKLAQLADIPSSVLSRWKTGQMQPGRENLLKLSVPLKVPPVNLYVVAGLMRLDEMEAGSQVDLTVLPAEIDDLIALYRDERTTSDDRAYLRRSITGLIAHVRADIEARAAVAPARKRGRGHVA